MSDNVIDFKQRLTGEVAAPGAPGDIRVDPDAAEWCPSCGAHWPVDEKHNLVEKLATSVERAAVVKYLREKAATCADPFWHNMVNLWASKIEKGAHL